MPGRGARAARGRPAIGGVRALLRALPCRLAPKPPLPRSRLRTTRATAPPSPVEASSAPLETPGLPCSSGSRAGTTGKEIPFRIRSHSISYDEQSNRLSLRGMAVGIDYRSPRMFCRRLRAGGNVPRRVYSPRPTGDPRHAPLARSALARLCVRGREDAAGPQSAIRATALYASSARIDGNPERSPKKGDHFL